MQINVCRLRATSDFITKNSHKNNIQLFTKTRLGWMRTEHFIRTWDKLKHIDLKVKQDWVENFYWKEGPFAAKTFFSFIKRKKSDELEHKYYSSLDHGKKSHLGYGWSIFVA